MYPCYFYEEGTQLPESGTYYVVAANGNWLHKDTGIVKAFFPVENIPILKELDAKPWVSCNIPKLPAKYVAQIKAFFQVVAERYSSEAIVILYYNKQDQSYKIVVPNQQVTHGSVIYQREGAYQDYLRVGTIHSHCDFGAFHSGTDVHDEEDFDGIHCTFGNNHQQDFTIVASIVANANRFTVDPSSILEGIELVNIITYKLTEEIDTSEVSEWLQKVNVPYSVSRTEDDKVLWPYRKEDVIKGDKVVWAGDLKTVPFKDVCGEGPFVVDSVSEGFYTLVTDVGLVRFSEKLFRKKDDDQKN